MKSTTNFAMALAVLMLSRVSAHLEINLVAGPSAKIPEQHRAESGGADQTTIFCRTALVRGDQSGRNPNDPNVGDICHGNEMIAEPKKLATLTAGGSFAWGILRDKLGSGHDGGHCSWWVSDGTNQKKWYKFRDDIDCTANAKGGNQPGVVPIPKILPLSCKSSCTIMWLWSPLHTGKCEIYSNCFDVKIEGVTGGIEDDYPTKTAPFDCIRVNTETHKTSAFGRFINVNSDDTIALEKVVDGDPNCYQYTVRPEDTKIAEVSAKFDLTPKEIYDMNDDVMVDSDTLPANGTKLTIVGCTGKESDSDKQQASDEAGLLHITAAVTLVVLSLSF